MRYVPQNRHSRLLVKTFTPHTPDLDQVKLKYVQSTLTSRASISLLLSRGGPRPDIVTPNGYASVVVEPVPVSRRLLHIYSSR